MNPKLFRMFELERISFFGQCSIYLRKLENPIVIYRHVNVVTFSMPQGSPMGGTDLRGGSTDRKTFLHIHSAMLGLRNLQI